MKESPGSSVQQQTSARQSCCRRRLGLLSIACVVLGIWCLTGCVSIVTPPSNPEVPVTVYLVSDASHTGLVFPSPKGGYVEYAYGEWDWYALKNDQWYSIFDTLLWPTQGTLGRRIVPADDGRALGELYASAGLEVIVVSSEKVADLLKELDRQYAKGLKDGPSADAYSLTFVKHDDGFWYLYNCKDATAEWLRRLDCSVSWVPIRLGLSLAPPKSNPSPVPPTRPTGSQAGQ